MKNTKGVILEQKGARMAEDCEDWNGLWKVKPFFFKYTNGDVAPLIFSALLWIFWKFVWFVHKTTIKKRKSEQYFKISLQHTRDTKPFIRRRAGIVKDFLRFRKKEDRPQDEQKYQSGFHCEGKLVDQCWWSTAGLIWFRNDAELLLKHFLSCFFIVYLLTNSCVWWASVIACKLLLANFTPAYYL